MTQSVSNRTSIHDAYLFCKPLNLSFQQSYFQRFFQVASNELFTDVQTDAI